MRQVSRPYHLPHQIPAHGCLRRDLASDGEYIHYDEELTYYLCYIKITHISIYDDVLFSLKSKQPLFTHPCPPLARNEIFPIRHIGFDKPLHKVCMDNAS